MPSPCAWAAMDCSLCGMDLGGLMNEGLDFGKQRAGFLYGGLVWLTKTGGASLCRVAIQASYYVSGERGP